MKSVPVTSIKLDASMKTRVQKLAELRRRTPHWVLCEAIAQYVEREEKREQLKQDAQRAWDDYRLTGMHISGEEADAWMKKLEAGEDVEPPSCHID